MEDQKVDVNKLYEKMLQREPMDFYRYSRESNYKPKQYLDEDFNDFDNLEGKQKKMIISKYLVQDVNKIVPLKEVKEGKEIVRDVYLTDIETKPEEALRILKINGVLKGAEYDEQNGDIKLILNPNFHGQILFTGDLTKTNKDFIVPPEYHLITVELFGKLRELVKEHNENEYSDKTKKEKKYIIFAAVPGNHEFLDGEHFVGIPQMRKMLNAKTVKLGSDDDNVFYQDSVAIVKSKIMGIKVIAEIQKDYLEFCSKNKIDIKDDDLMDSNHNYDLQGKIKKLENLIADMDKTLENEEQLADAVIEFSGQGYNSLFANDGAEIIAKNITKEYNKQTDIYEDKQTKELIVFDEKIAEHQEQKEEEMARRQNKIMDEKKKNELRELRRQYFGEEERKNLCKQFYWKTSDLLSTLIINDGKGNKKRIMHDPVFFFDETALYHHLTGNREKCKEQVKEQIKNGKIGIVRTVISSRPIERFNHHIETNNPSRKMVYEEIFQKIPTFFGHENLPDGKLQEISNENKEGFICMDEKRTDTWQTYGNLPLCQGYKNFFVSQDVGENLIKVEKYKGLFSGKPKRVGIFFIVNSKANTEEEIKNAKEKAGRLNSIINEAIKDMNEECKMPEAVENLMVFMRDAMFPVTIDNSYKKHIENAGINFEDYKQNCYLPFKEIYQNTCKYYENKQIIYLSNKIKEKLKKNGLDVKYADTIIDSGTEFKENSINPKKILKTAETAFSEKKMKEYFFKFAKHYTVKGNWLINGFTANKGLLEENEEKINKERILDQFIKAMENEVEHDGQQQDNEKIKMENENENQNNHSNNEEEMILENTVKYDFEDKKEEEKDDNEYQKDNEKIEMEKENEEIEMGDKNENNQSNYNNNEELDNSNHISNIEENEKLSNNTLKSPIETMSKKEKHNEYQENEVKDNNKENLNINNYTSGNRNNNNHTLIHKTIKNKYPKCFSLCGGLNFDYDYYTEDAGEQREYYKNDENGENAQKIKTRNNNGWIVENGWIDKVCNFFNKNPDNNLEEENNQKYINY